MPVSENIPVKFVAALQTDLEDRQFTTLDEIGVNRRREMSLNIALLEKVRQRGNKTIGRCPACAETGGDTSGEHLIIDANGAYGCVNNPGPAGTEHRKRIFALAGTIEPKTTSTPRPAPAKPAQSKPARTFTTAEEAAKRCTPKDGTLEQVYLYPKAGQPFAAVARYKTPAGKSFLQFHAAPAGWTPGAPASKWPLYGINAKPPTGQIFIVEGEKCQIAAAGIGLAAITSTGGSKAAAKTDWTPLSGHDVIILPDDDIPGETYAAEVLKILSELNPPARVRIVRLPGLNDGQDIVDFMENRDAAEPENIRKEILDLAEKIPIWTPAENVKTSTPDQDEAGDVNLQAHFFQIQQIKGLNASERYHKMANAVLETLHARGRFFFHTEHRDFSTAMFFDRKRKLLLPIAGDPFLSWLSGFIGINRTERAFQFILAAIQDEALTGKTIGLLPESFWAARPGALYLSNGDGHLVRITPADVTPADNGTDEILFPAGDTLAPWKLVEPSNPFDHCALFKTMTTAAPHGKDLFTLWACALASNQRTKPPLVLSGPIGSGKTRLAVGIAELYGLPPRITTITKNGEEDFWTQAHAGGIVCFDNADTRTDWLPDALAAAATDGCREKRRLYTDTARITQRARAWAIITSANPTFAADAGLADRLLVVRLERRTDETAEAALSDEIAAHRNAGLSWIADVLSVALADNKPVPGGLNKRHPDFSALAVRLGRAMGREQQAVKAIMTAEADKSLFNLENDEIGAALIELMRANDTFAGTAAELLAQLKTIDPSFEGRLSVKRLAKRLGRLWPHLAAVFDGKQEKGHGNLSQLFFRRPNGYFGYFETAFSEKSYEGQKVGRNAKTPLETNQTNQEPLFEHALNEKGNQ